MCLDLVKDRPTFLLLRVSGGGWGTGREGGGGEGSAGEAVEGDLFLATEAIYCQMGGQA